MLYPKAPFFSIMANFEEYLDGPSVAEIIANMDERELNNILSSVDIDNDTLKALKDDWYLRARPKQLPPPGDWYVWFLMCGRSWGKTVTGAMWLHNEAMKRPGRSLLMIGKEPADVRNKMLEGESGIFRNTPSISWDQWQKLYRPTQRKLYWPNGSYAEICSGANPDQVRGTTAEAAWLDEISSWKFPEDTWQMVQMAVREGDSPRICVTTTPKPIPVVKDLAALCDEKDEYIMVKGPSYENRALSERFFESGLAQYEGTSLGRQEIHADILAEAEGALWSRALLDKRRILPDNDDCPLDEAPPVDEMERIVIGVDPQASAGRRGGMTGIIAVGIKDRTCYVLADHSISGTPDRWGRAVVGAYHGHDANVVIGETNHGGDMIGHTIHVVDQSVSFKEVRASRGKDPRAEPVQALYQAGRVFHCGLMDDLEDELCSWVPNESSRQQSPHRLDALVWAVKELALDVEEPLRVAPIVGEFRGTNYWKFAG